MNLFVVEFASKSIKLIFEVICFLLGKTQVEIQVLKQEKAESFDFESWKGSLDSAFSALESGKFSAIQITSNDDNLQLATIYRPKFIGEGLGEYSCIGEFKSSLSIAESKMNELSTTTMGLSYLSLSLEEPLDINENIYIESDVFPWDDWRLVLGSCRSRELIKGAAYKKLLSHAD